MVSTRRKVAPDAAERAVSPQQDSGAAEEAAAVPAVGTDPQIEAGDITPSAVASPAVSTPPRLQLST